MAILAVNAGSSSLKYQVVDAVTGETAAVGLIERIGNPTGARLTHRSAGDRIERDISCADHREALAAATAALEEHGPDLAANPPFAVGHRVVHGGSRFSAPIVIDDAVIEAVRELAPLAPLHNPANLQGIVTAREAFPEGASAADLGTGAGSGGRSR